jgi:5-oxoprolinase (ATP-hydrolysing) subunit A
MKTIDLNCDLGELPEMLENGSQAALLRHITSANVACGGHAGNAAMMRTTIEQAIAAGVAVGAHLGYEDPANFGRIELELASQKIAASMHQQILSLDKIAKECGTHVVHVKPHGALYNQAARDRRIAKAIAEGVARWSTDVVLMGLAGSVMLEEFRKAGFRVAAEAFADRRYELNGSLRSRKFPDALLANPADAAEQALRIVQQQSVLTLNGEAVHMEAHTICIHGDTPGAVRIAESVNRELHGAGVTLKSLVT